VEPPVASAAGKKVVELRRMGKRICIGLEKEGYLEQKRPPQKATATTDCRNKQAEIWLVLHLMIAGRLHWGAKGKKLSKQHWRRLILRMGVCSGRRRDRRSGPSLHLARGRRGWPSSNRGGLEILDATLEQFSKILKSENHTLKRALTDPEWFSGIGNAYSDEILWEAKLSPLLQTHKMKRKRLRGCLRRRANRWRNGRTGCVPRRRKVSGGSDGVSSRDGGAWEVQASLSAMRRERAADQVCVE